MSRSSAILLSYTEQSVNWSSAVRTTDCDLKFRSSASARKDVIRNSALLLLHENITFLWKIHSHSTTHPFLNVRAILHEWWTLWRTKESRCCWQTSTLTFGCARHMLLTHYVHTVGTDRDRAARQALRYDRENGAVLLCWHTYVNGSGRRRYLPDVMDYLPIRSITVRGKSYKSISADRP